MISGIAFLFAMSAQRTAYTHVCEIIKEMPSPFQLRFYSRSISKITPMIAKVNETIHELAADSRKVQRQGMIEFLRESRHWAMDHTAYSSDALVNADLDPGKLDIFALMRGEQFKIECRRGVIKLSASGKSVVLDPSAAPNSNAMFGNAAPLRCDYDLYVKAVSLVKAGYYDLPAQISSVKEGEPSLQ